MSKFPTKASDNKPKRASRAASFLKTTALLYNNKQVAKAAAAMSYHLTMTFFPLIICLYALFGQSYATAERLLGFIRRFLTEEAAELIERYLKYLSGAGGTAIVVAAVIFLFSSASAAMRDLISTVGDIQSKSRFGMIAGYVVSFIMALGLLVVFYLAFVVLLTGERVVSFLQQKIPTLEGITDWTWFRFVLLGLMALSAMWLTFTLLKPKKSHLRTLPGALVSTAAIVVMSYIFSTFISASTRYSLIYGSLASLILMMFWIFLSCQMILLGACVNTALAKGKQGSFN